MTTTRSKTALFIGLPLALAIIAGSGLAIWDYGFRDNPGYPVKVMKQAEELHERMLSFDSHITVPQDFGTLGNEVDKDGTGQIAQGKVYWRIRFTDVPPAETPNFLFEVTDQWMTEVLEAA